MVGGSERKISRGYEIANRDDKCLFQMSHPPTPPLIFMTASGLTPAPMQNPLISSTSPPIPPCPQIHLAHLWDFSPLSQSLSPSRGAEYRLTSPKKTTDFHSYLDNTYFHPASCKDVIPTLISLSPLLLLPRWGFPLGHLMFLLPLVNMFPSCCLRWIM